VPDSPRDPYLGTWTGSIVSDVIGVGSATVVIDSQLGSPTTPLLNGNWTFVFSTARFSGSGTVSGNLNAEGTLLGLFFSPTVVPCSGQPDDVDQRVRAAILTVVANRMQGNYVVGGCPGGTIDLVRR